MTVNRHRSDPSDFAIEAPDLAGTLGFAPDNQLTATDVPVGEAPEPDTPMAVVLLQERIDDRGPLLPLTTKGEAEALYMILGMAGDAVPSIAPQVNVLKSRLFHRLTGD
ncbi:hypothetical protein Q3V23_23065 [Streptomyces sp. VNUA116]|uniref:hypothetical protein n=1 Tax=Streptomyces sp. VNUA116 TaxID=3062449 RepID=UPI0026764184|nr:hypothetical protein [Streptomyces sp. VNUA116]WKU46707.1 hypothetical protein Q3V23_23065 [Streptomyces sp. VNUA116]